MKGSPTEPGLCSWTLHLAPQLRPQMKLLGFVNEVSARQAAPDEGLKDHVHNQK